MGGKKNAQQATYQLRGGGQPALWRITHTQQQQHPQKNKTPRRSSKHDQCRLEVRCLLVYTTYVRHKPFDSCGECRRHGRSTLLFQLLTGSDQAVHDHVALLADAVRSVHGLHVVGGVPARVKQDHPVRPREGDARPAGCGARFATTAQNKRGWGRDDRKSNPEVSEGTKERRIPLHNRYWYIHANSDTAGACMTGGPRRGTHVDENACYFDVRIYNISPTAVQEKVPRRAT